MKNKQANTLLLQISLQRKCLQLLSVVNLFFFRFHGYGCVPCACVLFCTNGSNVFKKEKNRGYSYII